jgi:hypothetical protein
MPLATKNGSLIVKDGQIAENCGCCGDWWCYTDAANNGYGACCRGNAVSVVVSLSGYRGCSLSNDRITMPEQSQTVVLDISSGVPPQDSWTHQITQVVLGNREGRSVRLRLAELGSTMEFTVLTSGILLPESASLPCGGESHGGLFIALSRQPTESHPCSDVNAFRRWDWIIGKSYSTNAVAGGLGVPVGRYPTFCKLDILGVVYS